MTTRAGRGGGIPAAPTGRGQQGRNNCGYRSQPQSTKYKGNCTDLANYTFDCSDYKQADNYVTTLKRILEYVGSEYKHGGDIRSSLLNGAPYKIPLPTRPTPPKDADNLTPDEQMYNMIFRGEIDQLIKRISILSDNIQKEYSLVLGQCTDFLQSKLKQQQSWETVSIAQDAIARLKLIKSITFKFEDQKFLPLALYQAKTNLYSYRQGNATNSEYLQRFNNICDIATAYNGQLHDDATLSMVTKAAYKGESYNDLDEEKKVLMDTAAHDLCLATMFIAQSDRRRYGKLSEELENDFTKGNDDYPRDLVQAYRLINEYKNWNPRFSTPDPTRVAFTQQKSKGDKASKQVEEWHQDAFCHHCQEKGHIRPNYPKLQESENTEDNDASSESKAISKTSSRGSPKKSSKKNVSKKSFSQHDGRTDNDGDEYEGTESEMEDQFFNFGFCTTNDCSQRDLNLYAI